MARQETITQVTVHIDDPVPPHMLLRTCTVRRRADNSLAVINLAEWKPGDPDGIYNDTDYELVVASKTSAPPQIMAPVSAPSAPYVSSELATFSREKLAELAKHHGVDITAAKDKNAVIAAFNTAWNQ